MTTTSTVRWGVLGTARIATRKVIPAMQRGTWSRVVAIASRDDGKGRAAAHELGIDRAYGSYEELLADPEVDAIYNPLPNHLHVPWTIRAAEAGKHVLCEKPIALDAADARQLIAVRERTGVLVQEAFMVRSHPQWVAASRLVRSGRIGDLRLFAGFFSYYNDDPANIRNLTEYGGGGLMDIGCYLVHVSRMLFGREPVRVAALMERDPAMRVDRLTSMMLDYDGAQAVGTCSTQLVPYQRVQLLGTRGRIDVPDPVQRAAGSTDAHLRGRWRRPGGRRGGDAGARGVRPVHAAGGSVLARHPGPASCALSPRGLAPEHAGDRRADARRRYGGVGRALN